MGEQKNMKLQKLKVILLFSCLVLLTIVSLADNFFFGNAMPPNALGLRWFLSFFVIKHLYRNLSKGSFTKVKYGRSKLVVQLWFCTLSLLFMFFFLTFTYLIPFLFLVFIIIELIYFLLSKPAPSSFVDEKSRVQGNKEKRFVQYFLCIATLLAITSFFRENISTPSAFLYIFIIFTIIEIVYFFINKGLPPAEAPLVSSCNLEQIAKLKSLLDDGAITQEEFDLLKKELFDM